MSEISKWQCCICLANFPSPVPKICNAGHRVCRECTDEATVFETIDKCPTCRGPTNRCTTCGRHSTYPLCPEGHSACGSCLKAYSVRALRHCPDCGKNLNQELLTAIESMTPSPGLQIPAAMGTMAPHDIVSRLRKWPVAMKHRHAHRQLWRRAAHLAKASTTPTSKVAIYLDLQESVEDGSRVTPEFLHGLTEVTHRLREQLTRKVNDLLHPPH